MNENIPEIISAPVPKLCYKYSRFCFYFCSHMQPQNTSIHVPSNITTKHWHPHTICLGWSCVQRQHKQQQYWSLLHVTKTLFLEQSKSFSFFPRTARDKFGWWMSVLLQYNAESSNKYFPQRSHWLDRTPCRYLSFIFSHDPELKFMKANDFWH